VLRRVLTQAVRWEWVWTNPAEHACPWVARRREMFSPPPAAVARLLAATREMPGLHACFRVVVSTGAGRSHVCALWWTDLDSTTTRFADDGTFLTVVARGLSDDEIEAVVGGVGPADTASWTALQSQISEALAAAPISATVQMGDDVLTFRGDPLSENPVQGAWQPDEACVSLDGVAPACGAFLSARDSLFGPTFASSAGWSRATNWSIDGMRFATTVTTADGWWVLGVDEMADEIVVMTGDSRAADQHSARIDGLGVAFVAPLPDSSTSATVFANANDYPTREGADPRSFDWYTDVFQPAV